jgi:hypothetical protein
MGDPIIIGNPADSTGRIRIQAKPFDHTGPELIVNLLKNTSLQMILDKGDGHPMTIPLSRNSWKMTIEEIAPPPSSTSKAENL